MEGVVTALVGVAGLLCGRAGQRSSAAIFVGVWVIIQLTSSLFLPVPVSHLQKLSVPASPPARETAPAQAEAALAAASQLTP
jgi:hypothetical protein